MAIPRHRNMDAVTPTPQVETVKVQPKTYHGATVDTREVRFDQLLTSIAGQSWTVDWFSLIKGRDDDNRPFESDSHPVYQQYKLIQGFELKVTSPLATTQVSDTKDMTTKGTANVYGIVIPKEGDCFLADIGDGREGLLSVISSTRMSLYAAAVHEIEYQLIQFSSAELRAQMDRKVQERLVFHKDFLDTGNSPLLSPEESSLVNNMKEHYSRLISLYFHDFFSRDKKTLLVPNQPRVTYDPFLIRYLKTILTSDDHPAMRLLREFNVQGDQTMYEFTLWNCLETMDDAMLAMAVHQAGLVDIKQFWNGRPTLNSIYFTGVETVVYPDMAPTNVDAGYSGMYDPALTDLVRGCARFAELNRLVRSDLIMDPTFELYEVNDPKRASQIKRVTVDNYYVLSEPFYLHTPDKALSKLETLTLAALRGDAIDLAILDHLCTHAPKWDNVERFYYFPILFTLLKVYQRRIK